MNRCQDAYNAERVLSDVAEVIGIVKLMYCWQHYFKDVIFIHYFTVCSQGSDIFHFRTPLLEYIL